MLRGQVWWADLGEPRGSAPARRRPVLVVQADVYNRTRLSTAVVVVITSQTQHAGHPGNVFLPAGLSGLPRDSVVNVTAVTTVDRSDMDTSVGTIPAALMGQVDIGLRMVLGLR